jgi:hypothetical protein
MCTSVPIFTEPFEQPALDRAENLQLDGYRQQLGFDLPALTNCIGVGIARSATLVDTFGCDGSRVVAIGRQPSDLLHQVDHKSPPRGDNCCPLGTGGVAPQRLIDERVDTGVPNPNRQCLEVPQSPGVPQARLCGRLGAPWLDAQGKTRRGRVA